MNQVLSNITLADFQKNSKAINAAFIETVKLSAHDPTLDVQILNVTSARRRLTSSSSSLLIQYKIIFPTQGTTGPQLTKLYDTIVGSLKASVSSGNFTTNLRRVAVAAGVRVLVNTGANILPTVSNLIIEGVSYPSPSPVNINGPVSVNATMEPTVSVSNLNPVASSSKGTSSGGLSTANIAAIAVLSISAISILVFLMCFKAYQNMSKGYKMRSIGDIEVGSVKLRSSGRLDEPLYKRHFPKTIATRDDSFFDSIYAENPRIAQQNLKPTQNPLRKGPSNKPAVASAKRSAKAARLKKLNDKINDILENFDKTLSRRDFNEYVSELGSVIQEESVPDKKPVRKVPKRPVLSLDSKSKQPVRADPVDEVDDGESEDENDEILAEIEIRRTAANQKLLDMVKVAHNEYLKCVDEEAEAARQLQEANRLVREAELRKVRESEKLVTIDQRLSVIQSINPRESMYLEQMKRESEARLSVLETDIRDLKESTELRSNLQDAENKRVAAETRAEILQKELEAFRSALSTGQALTRQSVSAPAPVMRETTVSSTANADKSQMVSSAVR